MSILGHASRPCLLAAVLAGAAFWPAAIRAEPRALLTDVAMVRTPASASALNLVPLMVDFAKIIQLDGDIGSIVLGNSAIADATLTNGRMIVLTGKSIGMTNMIILGVDNLMLAEMTLQVSGRKPGTVTVRRALDMQSYACETGLCKSTQAESVAGAVVAAQP